MTDRFRTAAHEGGHAVADVLLMNRPPSVVSIRPGADHHGVTIGDGRLIDRSKVAGKLGTEVAHADAVARAHLEAAIVGCLAGDLAGELLGQRRSGYIADPPHATEAVESLTRLSPRHRELLAAAEADREPLTDEAAALLIAEVLAHQEARAYLEWMRAVAHRFVREYLPAIESVALALIESDVIDGQRVLAIVRGGERNEHAA